jgi:DNA-binding winged helix-turn-helix (wHTH) protein
VRFRFGEFALDTERRQLSRGAERVRLSPKAFQLLAILAEQRPKAVSQQEIYDAIWPGSLVHTSSLHKLIHEVRAALDDGEHKLVCTVYGYGFSFAAEDSPVVSWQLIVNDEVFVLRAGENIVGRDVGMNVRIDVPSVSRRHARLIVERNHVLLEDLGSKNGTRADGRLVREPVKLSSNTSLTFGAIRARLLHFNPLMTESVDLPLEP